LIIFGSLAGSPRVDLTVDLQNKTLYHKLHFYESLPAGPPTDPGEIPIN
jgi:hypothetical protein